jgi:GlpG protein
MGALLEIRPLGELLQTHQWWRLVGPNFLHFSFMHIAFNLVWWWMLGRQLEISFGTSAIIIFFFIASLFANVSQLIVSGPNFGGLSGIVYALVGFVWWIGLLRPTWLISLPNNVIYFLLAWLVIGYFDILWVNMANEAHTFGLISGCLMALIIHLGSPKSDKAS